MVYRVGYNECLRKPQGLPWGVSPNKILDAELIPSGSLTECEIRAASILTCKHMARVAGCTMCEIDSYLWLQRNKYKQPFHLTITSNY